MKSFDVTYMNNIRRRRRKKGERKYNYCVTCLNALVFGVKKKTYGEYEYMQYVDWLFTFSVFAVFFHRSRSLVCVCASAMKKFE